MPLLIVVLLLALVASAVPVAAVLGILSLSLDEVSHARPPLPHAGRLRLGAEHRVHPGRDPHVHPARRDHAQSGNCVAHVQRGDPVDLLAAGRTDARQYRVVRDLRRLVGLQRSDRGNRGHGGLSGNRETQIQRTPVPRLARRRRHTRHSHSTLDQSHHLRPPDRQFGARALSRRHHSGAHAGHAVHGHDRDRLPPKPGLGRRQGRDLMGGAHQGAARPPAPDHPLHGGRRIDLCRRRDADRGGLHRRRLRARDRRLEQGAQRGDAQGRVRRHHAVELDHHADHPGRRVPQFRARLHGRSPSRSSPPSRPSA